MTKIFIIKSSGGSYDDAWESNLFAVTDQEQAEREVAKLSESHEFFKSIWSQIFATQQVWYKKIRDLNTVTYASTLNLPPEPRGPARGNKTTIAEYRKLHDAWRAECAPIWDEIRRKQNELMMAANEAALAKAKELGCTDEHLKQLGFYNEFTGELQSPSFRQDTAYHYEELELR